MENQLNLLNVKTVVVTFEAGFIAQQYVEDTQLNWPLLIDKERDVYHGYGMLEASFWDVWGPKTLWAYFKEALKGKFPEKSDGDVSQRGGDVLISPEGIVKLVHAGDGPADRPPVENLLKLIRNS